MEKSFGIGCFHFGVKENPPFDFDGLEYIAELQKSLSNITNISNIKIESDKEFKKTKVHIKKKPTNMEEDEGYFPDPAILNIEFELYIPFRIQSELAYIKEINVTCYTEKFKVKIIHNFYLPVAIIECINPSEESDPSLAVQIVREFIRKELNSDYIRFEVLGPSPFHFDCFLKPITPEESETFLFKDQIDALKAYDRLTMFYNSLEFNNAEEAMSHLENLISDEFGFFYDCVQNRYLKMHYWEQIHNNLELLVKIQNSKGLKGLFKKTYSRPKLIENLFSDISNFESKFIILDNIQHNNYNQIYSFQEEVYFKYFIDKQLEEKYDYPVKQTINLVEFFEGRRVKNVEISTALLTAILGGVIGSLLTYLLTP